MPANKIQHYVPRCYLKAFSHGEEGKAISLYNLNKKKFIDNAPLKNQCAKDYFYGKDLSLEKILQAHESAYAHISRKVIQGDILNTDELWFLKDFVYLQYMRTEYSLNKFVDIQKYLKNTVNKMYPESINHDYLSIDHETVLRRMMVMYHDTRNTIEDLSLAILSSKRRIDFISSDNPSIMTNKYYFQKLPLKKFGTKSSGLIFILPVNKNICILLYDDNIYYAPNKKGYYIEIKKDSDVESINHFQYINCLHNIYLSENYNTENIRNYHDKYSHLRLKSYSQGAVFAKKNRDEVGHKYFRIIEGLSEVSEKDNIITFSPSYPKPALWFSELKYRLKPRYCSTGSMAGHVRPVHAMSSMLD